VTNLQTHPFKYWAFISYSHLDKKWGDWLHRSLERYKVPKRLVSQLVGPAEMPKRVFPIFRDREELPASADLSRQVNEALSLSRVLIVICSPNSARSRWVNEEIKYFKSLGREDRVLGLIVDGEPNASDGETGFKLEEECFPEALRFRVGAAGEITGDRAEPIAADLRKSKDGRSSAKIKLLAGILSVEYDSLRRREQERQRRSLLALTTGALAIAIVMCALTAFAFMQQREAKKQQKIAQAQQREADRQKVIAQKSEAATRRQLAELYAERGRQELASGDPTRAAPFLSAAYTANPQQHGIQSLLGIALRYLTAQSLVLSGHTHDIKHIARSEDGRYIVSSQTDGLVNIWDVNRGKLVRSLPPEGSPVDTLILVQGNKLVVGGATSARSWSLDGLDPPTKFQHGYGQIFAIAVSSDSKLLATASMVGLRASDTTVKVWDLNTGKELAAFSHGYKTLSLQFSHDGHKLLTGADDGHVCLWDWASGRRLLDLGHGEPGEGIQRVCFNASEDVIASLDEKSGAKIWSATNGSLLGACAENEAIGWRILEFDAKGDRLLVGELTDCFIYDWKAGKRTTFSLKESLFGVQLLAAHFSPDGQYIVATCSDRAVRVIRTVDAKIVATLRGHSAQVADAIFSNDGHQLISGSWDRQIIIWNWERLREAPPLEGLPNPCEKVMFSKGAGNRILASALGFPNLYVWDANTGELQQKLVQPLAFPPSGLTWCCSPDGETVATCGSNPATYARLWRFATGQRLKDFARDAHVGALAFASNSKTIAMGGWDDKVNVLDKFNGAIEASFSVSKLRSLYFSPDDSELLAIGSEQCVAWQFARGSSFALSGHRGQFLQAGFTADGERIVTTSEDRTARIWDAHDGSQIYVLDAHAARIDCLGISPKNNLIATSGGNGSVSFWDARTGQLVSVWEDPDRMASHCIIFSPSGELTAVAVLEGVYIVDPETGLTLQKIAADAHDVSSMDFSPDGTKIVVGRADNGISIIQLSIQVGTPEEVSTLLQKVGRWRLKGTSLVSNLSVN
jgi:WD40 repeat protein